MRKLLLLFLLVTCTQSFCSAQNRCYETYDDFRRNKFISLDTLGLTVMQHPSSEPGYSEILTLKFETNDRKFTRKLKKDVLIVCHGGFLLFNLSKVEANKSVFRNRYVKTFLLGEDKICFVAPHISSAKDAGIMVGALLGGVIGAAVATAGMNDVENHRVYYLNSNDKVAKMFTYDFMCELMGRYNPQLLIEYIIPEVDDEFAYECEVEKREVASVVQDYLKRMHLL